MCSSPTDSRTMSGTQKPQPRWKRSVSTVSGVLGEAVGEMYVAKYFPPENKERMEKLVRTFRWRWLSASTRRSG